MIVKFETEAAHGAFEIVHAKTLFPTPKPVRNVVGETELEIAPIPETNVHTPEPTAGVFALISAFGLEIQSV